ncbi:glycosyltransferase [Evansella cellulosilytica]|uniref:Glycosyl transferase group 1 n=1 Tax=Evansella cellulosilytica (strain ATCC 21833 / DSM 2522 / FERM P-1141 / JCM 9156 / N-4) TaxID=649639 RepID=E6TWC4_EVAC2|nr:glycosyltransferase [Evansella cellulosilytica]ADU31080.1 glycosyl transferase group 1 [Evansella cellulosilytica DSM 2522]
MKKIAFIRTQFLPITETFIYEELINIKQFSPIVITEKELNAHLFPYKHIIKVSHLEDELPSILQKENIKLLHVRFGTTAIRLIKLLKEINIPTITSFHGYDVPDPEKKTPYHVQLKSLFQVGDCFTATSCYMKNKLIALGCPPNKIHVQKSGIDLNKFQYRKPRIPLEGEKVQILSVGRFVEKKGFQYLLKAFSKVQKKYPVKLTLIGDGPRRKEIIRIVKKHKMKKSVQIKDPLPHKEIVKEMARAHIFCLPSVTEKNGNQEGIPNVLKEAMAIGVPIVTTEHAGIPELIEHKVHGYLVHERDVRGLVHGLVRIIDDSHSWEKMTLRARKKIEKSYNSTIQVKQLENLYTSLID